MFFVIGVFEDKGVFGLLGSELVVVDFDVVVLVFFGDGAGGGETVVEEAGVVVFPGDGDEFGVLDDFGVVFAGFGVFDVVFLPVGAVFGQTVTQQFTVFGVELVHQGGGAVFGEGVGVEEDFGGTVKAFLFVEDRLIFGAVVEGVEQPIPFLGDFTVLVKVPEVGEAFFDGRAVGRIGDEGLEELVLGFGEGLGVWGGGVFEPAVGVGGFCAVIVFDDVVFFGGRVDQGHGVSGFRDWLIVDRDSLFYYTGFFTSIHIDL